MGRETVTREGLCQVSTPGKMTRTLSLNTFTTLAPGSRSLRTCTAGSQTPKVNRRRELTILPSSPHRPPSLPLGQSPGAEAASRGRNSKFDLRQSRVQIDRFLQTLHLLRRRTRGVFQV